jgi:hypothetical protein
MKGWTAQKCGGHRALSGWWRRGLDRGRCIIAILTLVVLALSGCFGMRRGEVREFPENFHGWAFVIWGIPGYPPLPTDHGKLGERFPDDGTIITSTEPEYGVALDEDFYLRDDGKRDSVRPSQVFVWPGKIKANGRQMYYTRFFVGTEAELPKVHAEDERIWRIFWELVRGTRTPPAI